MPTNLSQNELQRYNRQLILPEVGTEGQEKLKHASVLVVGAGGLGCPVLQYLAAAGVGTLGIVDGDQVNTSNLHRQILYSEEDVGSNKADKAAEKLKNLNPEVEYRVFREHLTNDNVLDVFKTFDFIVDGTDNFPTRYRVNDACVILNKPFVAASIFLYEGQLSVFNYQGGATYRCLYPEPPDPESVPSCAEIGVLGIIPGILGTWQANEVLKMILGYGEVLSNQLLLFDTKTCSVQKMHFKRNPENFNITELTDYEGFCEGEKATPSAGPLSIDPETLREWIQKNKDFQLIDVREPHEYEICHLEHARLIPQQQIPEKAPELDSSKPTVVYCHHGMRSANAIQYLQQNHGMTNLYNLEGGIDAWASEVDPEMQRY